MTEPASITAWRVMLLACPSVVAAGLASTNLYYPSAAPSPDHGVAGTVAPPYGVLSEKPATRKRFLSAGTVGLPYGTLKVVFYLATDIGTAESLTRTVESDLYAVVTNAFAISNVSTELAGKPTPGQIAASGTKGEFDYAISLTADYGLGR